MVNVLNGGLYCYAFSLTIPSPNWRMRIQKISGKENRKLKEDKILSSNLDFLIHRFIWEAWKCVFVGCLLRVSKSRRDNTRAEDKSEKNTDSDLYM